MIVVFCCGLLYRVTRWRLVTFTLATLQPLRGATYRVWIPVPGYQRTLNLPGYTARSGWVTLPRFTLHIYFIQPVALPHVTFTLHLPFTLPVTARYGCVDRPRLRLFARLFTVYGFCYLRLIPRSTLHGQLVTFDAACPGYVC